jgi:ParB family chromosome partitioning protein
MSEPKRRGLGRGLDALIISTEGGEGTHDASTGGPEAGNDGRALVRQLPVSTIQANPHQPRTHFDDAALDELAESIRSHGIIQPLLVAQNPQRPDLFWLIAGERRWRAAQRAGLESVPAIVRDATARELVELAIIENVQRADLHPLEEAAAYAALIDEHGMTQADVADRVGKSRPAVANTVRLLHLPLAARNALLTGAITTGHARALLALDDDARIEEALAVVIARELTVRQTEALVKQMLSPQSAETPAKRTLPQGAEAAQVTRMEEGFRRALGTKVALNRNAQGAGKLTIHFYNDDDLEAIYRLIAGDEDQDSDFSPDNLGG